MPQALLVRFMRSRLDELAGEGWLLADVEAKRRILDEYERYDEYSSDPCESCWAQGVGTAVRLLAQQFADHPDYRDGPTTEPAT